MKLLGFFAAAFFYCGLLFSATNRLPAVVESQSSEVYLDINKPLSLEAMKDVIDSLVFLEIQTQKALNLAKVLREEKASEAHWENFVDSYRQIAVQNRGFLRLEIVLQVLDEALFEAKKAYNEALARHNHYYLKQTKEVHLEYLQALKHTTEQLNIDSKFIINIGNKALKALNENLGPSDKSFSIELTEYRNQVGLLREDLQFLKNSLHKAYKKHAQFAELEQQHSFLSFKSGRQRVPDLVTKAVEQLRAMSYIAKTALEQGQNLSTAELIALLVESKNNQRPMFIQLMQVLDVEKFLDARPILSQIENALKAQSQQLDNYLKALEVNTRSGVIDSKNIEEKYHHSFFVQMESIANKAVGLKCQVLFL